MDWFTAALIGAVSMALAWIALKKAQEKGISNTYALAGYYVVMVIGLFFWHLIKGTPLPFPSAWAWLFFILSAAIPVISNLLIMHSFERSTNPGLTLSLVATQAIWLFIAGVVIFGAGFSFLALIGVLLAAAGVAVIHYQHKKTGLRWVFYGLLAGVLNALYWVMVKGMKTYLPQYSSTALLFYLVLPSIFFYLLIGLYKKQLFIFSLPNVLIVILSGVIGTIANLAILFGILYAPNPGYANAISSSNALITLLLSPLVSTTSTLQLKHLASAALIVGGVILIRLAS